MKPVWDKPNPVKKSQALTSAQKAKARARARNAGRPYPNMVDNIWAARNEENMMEAKATYCGRCGTTHVPPKFGGKCPALREEAAQLDEVGNTTRGQKLLQMVNKRAVNRLTSKRADTDPAYAKKAQQTHLAANERLKEEQVNEISKELANRYMYSAMSDRNRTDQKISKAADKNREKFSTRRHSNIMKMLAKTDKRTTGISKAIDRLQKEDHDMCNVCGQTPCNCTYVNEAPTSVAVRMQRALEKIKAERERSERRGKEVMDQIRQKQEQEKKPMKEQKTLKQVVEAQLHPDALHVIPTKVNGQQKYKVHAVGKNLAGGIKVGEHLTDSHLDDAAEMGAKIKQVKHVAEEGTWFGNKTKKKSNSVSLTAPEHENLQSRGERNKSEGTDESFDYKARFASLLTQHGYQQKLVEWRDSTVTEEEEHVAAIKNIKKNIENRVTSTDKDTDVIRDYDADEPRKQETLKRIKHHHKKMKNFRTYFEDVNESISSRQALAKAADMEFKAANTDSPQEENRLKGKAKALRRAARLAQKLASTVDVDVSKTK